jgi:hypothetical protein
MDQPRGRPNILLNSPKDAAPSPATEPTERSSAPDTSSMAPGTATMPRIEIWSRTTVRFDRVKNAGEETVK